MLIDSINAFYGGIWKRKFPGTHPPKDVFSFIRRIKKFSRQFISRQARFRKHYQRRGFLELHDTCTVLKFELELDAVSDIFRNLLGDLEDIPLRKKARKSILSLLDLIEKEQVPWRELIHRTNENFNSLFGTEIERIGFWHRTGAKTASFSTIEHLKGSIYLN